MPSACSVAEARQYLQNVGFLCETNGGWIELGTRTSAPALQYLSRDDKEILVAVAKASHSSGLAQVKRTGSF